MAIVSERTDAVPAGVDGAVVTDARLALLALARRIHRWPAHGVEVVGVAGTDGKTTTCHLIHHLVARCGTPAAVTGTVGSVIRKVAVAHADTVVVTSEDSHEENPRSTMDAIVRGMAAADPDAVSTRTVCIADREEAIHHAIGRARPGDTVVITGMGHQTTMNTGGVERPWSDERVARAALRRRCGEREPGRARRWRLSAPFHPGQLAFRSMRHSVPHARAHRRG